MDAPPLGSADLDGAETRGACKVGTAQPLATVSDPGPGAVRQPPARVCSFPEPARVVPVYEASPDPGAVDDDLQRVCEESGGELTLEGLMDALSRGSASLWLVTDADGFHVGTVVSEARGGRLNLVAVRLRYNGALGTVLEFFGRLAAESGLRLMCFSRRPGMRRLLGQYGWTPTTWREYQAP